MLELQYEHPKSGLPDCTMSRVDRGTSGENVVSERERSESRSIGPEEEAGRVEGVEGEQEQDVGRVGRNEVELESALASAALTRQRRCRTQSQGPKGERRFGGGFGARMAKELHSEEGTDDRAGPTGTCFECSCVEL